MKLLNENCLPAMLILPQFLNLEKSCKQKDYYKQQVKSESKNEINLRPSQGHNAFCAPHIYFVSCNILIICSDHEVHM